MVLGTFILINAKLEILEVSEKISFPVVKKKKKLELDMKIVYKLETRNYNNSDMLVTQQNMQ